MTIKFRTNARKAVEVIVWFAHQRPGIDFHSILKMLFFADLFHLNQWGRPIVGDTYYALPYGPVPQTTYDLLKHEPLALEMLDESNDKADILEVEVHQLEKSLMGWEGLAFLESADFTRITQERRAPAYARMAASVTADDASELPFVVRDGYRVWALRDPDLKKLSESDLDALNKTWERLSGLNFNRLTKLSHEHPAYRNAERAGRQQMAYEDFLEGKNAQADVIQDLQESAPRIVI
jgi:hypothetical protein